MIIQVCQSCIDLQRNPNHGQECAIYSALKKEFPDRDICVNQDTIRINELTFVCMPEVYGWQLGNIYNSQKAKPVSLVFDIKELTVGIYINDVLN